MSTNSHHTLRQSLQKRIESGEWALGTLIPSEMILAEEYNCARTTINRALQALANEGLLIRKRKGGTRVCQRPVRQAKFEIPILREQVEATACLYDHKTVLIEKRTPTSEVCSRLHLPETACALYIETIHLADKQPYAFEQRWVNTHAVPDIASAPLNEISANEWLVKTVPFSNGDIVFSAENATRRVAEALKNQLGDALFVVDRTTWMNSQFITTVKLYYKQGYRLHSSL